MPTLTQTDLSNVQSYELEIGTANPASVQAVLFYDMNWAFMNNTLISSGYKQYSNSTNYDGYALLIGAFWDNPSSAKD